jgi:hypothetical protein
MALPEIIRVKLSSEAAGAIELTPVVAQDLPVRELVDFVLALAGKDEARILEILSRGALVSGGSRLRWQGWKPRLEDLRELLATFPDPDPGVRFSAERCIRASLRGGHRPIEAAREALQTGRVGGFWEALMAAAGPAPSYAGYYYRERADLFVRDLNTEEIAAIRTAAAAVRFGTLREQIRTIAFTSVEFYVLR